MVQIIERKTWDAIVIGSGVTGGWAAKELTEKGLETLVLEAGPPVVPERRLQRAHAPLADALPRPEGPQAPG